MGSLLPFATLANRENRNKELSVSFRQFIHFILHLQRMAAIRRFCRISQQRERPGLAIHTRLGE